jgi:hypothetical protein
LPAHDPGERRLQAQLAANVRWSKEDPHDPAGPLVRARHAYEQRFYVGIPTDLPDAERDRRAAAARRAHYQQLALKSLKARRARKAPPAAGDAA